MERYASCGLRPAETFKEFVLKFVVDLHSVEFSARLQRFRHAEGGIAGESTQFKHTTRTNHRSKHLQEASLHMARTHPRIKMMEMGLAIGLREERGFFRYVGRDIFLDQLIRHLRLLFSALRIVLSRISTHSRGYCP